MIRREHWPVLGITLLALALRLVNLSGRTTEYDEILSVWFAAADPATVLRGTAVGEHPPLYYLLLHIWSPSVSALWWERLPSVLFSTATVPILYALGRRTVGQHAALVGALLMAVSPFFIFYAQFARMYSLLLFLLVGAALCLLVAARTGSFVWLGGYSVAALAALYTLYLSVLSIAAVHLAAIIISPSSKRRRFVVGLLVGDAIVLTGYLPWLGYLPEQLAKIERAFWIPRPGPAELVRTPIYFLFNLPAPPWALPVLLFWTVLLVAAGTLVAWRTVKTGRGFGSGPRAVAAIAVVPVLLMFLVSQVRPVYVERGVMVAAAASYLLLGWAFVQVGRRWERWVLAAGTLVLMAGSLAYYYTYTEFPRSRYAEAASYLAGAIRPGDALLHETKLTYLPMVYFRPDLPHHFVADPPGSPNDTLAPATMETFGIAPSQPGDVTTTGGRVWAVLYRRSFAEAARQGGEPPLLRVLSETRQRAEAVNIGDLVLVPFDRRAP